MIASETVFAGRLISVRVDQVEAVGGRRARREVVVHPGAVAVVPVLSDGQVLMVRQYRHAAGRVLWELPAGTLAPGESPLACAQRELAEETGFAADTWHHLFSTYLSPGYSTELIHLFLAQGLRPIASAPEEDERLEPVALPLAEAVAKVGCGEVQNAAAICGLLAVARWGGAAAGAVE